MKVAKYVLDFDLPIEDPNFSDIQTVRVALVDAGMSFDEDVHPYSDTEITQLDSVNSSKVSIDLTDLLKHYVSQGYDLSTDKMDILVFTIDAVSNTGEPAVLAGQTFDVTPPPSVLNLELRLG